jgi:glycosyltransferase involved in cell wall biosynthesis
MIASRGRCIVKSSIARTNPIVLVLASTYPRWRHDPEPGFVHRLCAEIAKDDNTEIHVLCPHAPGSLTREKMDGVTIHRFRYAPLAMESLIANGGIMANLKASKWKWLLVPLFMLSMQFALFRLLRKLKPDLLHVHWIIPQGIAVWPLSWIVRLPPLLITSHGGDLFGLQHRIMQKLKAKTLNAAQHVTVVSTAMLEPARKLGASEHRLSVAPMGVDFLNDADLQAPATSARIPGRILFVGRLVEKKGLAYLLEALPEICHRVPKAHLVIAGAGPEYEALSQQAQALGIADHIRFLGAVPHQDLPSLYRSATLFVAPFIQARSGDVEGLGLVTLEAICCDCPVLIGNVAATHDIFPEDIRHEYLVNPLNPTGMVDAISARLISPPAPDMRLRNHVMEHFSWPTVARRYQALYTSLMPTIDTARQEGDKK